MSWHRTPTSDDWRAVTPESVAALDQALWLYCSQCHRERLVDTLPWCERAGIAPSTPLLEIGRRMRCSGCGERRVSVGPEPTGLRSRLPVE